MKVSRIYLRYIGTDGCTSKLRPAATAITDFLDAKAVAMIDDGSAEATEIDDLVNELPDIEDQASKVDGPIG